MAYWTTRDVAAFLRLNEKKIYALVKAGKLPAARISGKWLFERELVERWVREHTVYPTEGMLGSLLDRLLVIQGSDDWLLERALAALGWDLRTSLVSSRVGSFKGLEALRNGLAHVVGFHIEDDELSGMLPEDAPCYLLDLYEREQGLVVAEHLRGEIRAMTDVVERGLRFAARSPSAGTWRVTERLLQDLGHEAAELSVVGPLPSHADVALAVRSGRADVGMAIRVAAEHSGLEFVPLHRETYRLAIPGCYLREAPLGDFLDRLLQWLGDRDSGSTPGYGLEHTGRLTPVCV